MCSWLRKIEIVILLGTLFVQNSWAEASKKVLISQVVTHIALDRTVQGLIQELEDQGFKKDENVMIVVNSAQADPSMAAQIASNFMGRRPDVVVGVGTLSAQSFLRYALKGDVPLVFASVTDPIKAGLIPKLRSPVATIKGVSNYIDLKSQLDLFKKIQPSLKRLGILYNSGEINSVIIVKKLQEICFSSGVTLIKQSVTKTADVPLAARKLAGEVDAIFISNDNTALSALQTIVSAAKNNKIPLYVSDTDAVSLGALAALGPNQYEIGRQAGKMVVCFLKGQINNVSFIEYPQKIDFYFNKDMAQYLGITLSEDLMKSAIVISKEARKNAI